MTCSAGAAGGVWSKTTCSLSVFFTTYGSQLTQRHAAGLSALMELSDNDLMDLFLRRKEPEGDLDTAEVHEVLAMVRKPL